LKQEEIVLDEKSLYSRFAELTADDDTDEDTDKDMDDDENGCDDDQSPNCTQETMYQSS
jgi:hypothetical protein